MQDQLAACPRIFSVIEYCGWWEIWGISWTDHCERRWSRANWKIRRSGQEFKHGVEANGWLPLQHHLTVVTWSSWRVIFGSGASARRIIAKWTSPRNLELRKDCLGIQIIGSNNIKRSSRNKWNNGLAGYWKVFIGESEMHRKSFGYGGTAGTHFWFQWTCFWHIATPCSFTKGVNLLVWRVF